MKLSRIISKKPGKPYTEEQLRNTPYHGTALEQADRAAGGPEMRAKIRKMLEALK